LLAAWLALSHSAACAVEIDDARGLRTLFEGRLAEGWDDEDWAPPELKGAV
jgi:hypothetical protein